MANSVKNATPIVPENSNSVKSFDQLKRDYETALSSGTDSGPALLTLSAAVAHSVIRKLIDPQRKPPQTVTAYRTAGATLLCCPCAGA